MLIPRIVPAVIPSSRQQLDATLEILKGFASHVQVDIVDGVFANPTSWPYSEESGIEAALETLRFDDVSVEFDLMIQNPEETLDTWLKTKPSRIIVHIESTNNLDTVLAHAKVHEYELGLACNNDTDLGVLHEIDREAVDFVQLMGIAEIGSQGQPFDERVLERVREVKEAFPELPVSIDGGVNKETLPLLREAGADRFVAGSAILKADDPEAAYQELVQLAQQ